MATFQMEKRQPTEHNQRQQRQRTNLKQRATVQQQVANATTTSQRRRRQQRRTDPPTTSAAAAAVVVVATAATSTRLPATQLSANSSAPPTLTCMPRLWPGSCTRNIEGLHYSCQRAFIMLTMLVVVILVISGNGVLAAQRDSYKSKDMSSSNNAIPNSDAAVNAAPNGVGGSGSLSSNGNSNSNSNSNANNNNVNNIGISNGSNGNNKNGHATATAAGGSMTTISNNSGSSSSSSSSSTTTVTGIASSSLHKVSSSSSGSNTIASAASGINRNSIELMEDARNAGPYFDKAASKNVTALLGKTAYLNCRVKNLGNKTMLLQVSWVRHRDIHLLTVGRYTYTSDQRFRAIHQPQTEDWMLQIKYPQHRDSGIYECQVSTTPHMSHYIHLTVVEPSTEIIGAPDLYIESGSTINLTCVILNSPEPPAYIFWNHNNAIINYDSPRGGVSVVTNKGDTTTSFLLIKSARPSDSGHYQCNPSNAKPKSVTVHVLNGEFPAAMQHAALAHPHMSQSRYLLVYLFVCLCSSAFVRHYMRPSAQQRRQSHGRAGVASAAASAVAVSSAMSRLPLATDTARCDISLNAL